MHDGRHQITIWFLWLKTSSNFQKSNNETAITRNNATGKVHNKPFDKLKLMFCNNSHINSNVYRITSTKLKRCESTISIAGIAKISLHTITIRVAHNSFQCLTASHKMEQFLLCRASHLPARRQVYGVVQQRSYLQQQQRRGRHQRWRYYFVISRDASFQRGANFNFLPAPRCNLSVSPQRERGPTPYYSILLQSITRAIHTNKLNRSSWVTFQSASFARALAEK